MIIKGKSRSGSVGLAKHLGNAEKNERITLIETRGTISADLRGALVEMDAVASGTRCEMPLYHAAISPGPQYKLTPEQREDAINALEEKLGLKGHARVVVLHEKLGRQHFHIVWSRINLETMKSASDSHNYRKHEEVSRDLERRWGHERVQGAHHEREGVARPDRTPSRAELRQEERTGIRGKNVKKEITTLFRASDGAEAFQAAVKDAGYVLARGDSRDFVIIDRAGGIHSLARRLDGIRAAELREFMSPIDREALPTADRAKAVALERQHELLEQGLEKRYSRGGDYVTQSSAAMKDHIQKQKELDGDNDSIRTFDYGDPEKTAETNLEDERLRRQADETTGRQQGQDAISNQTLEPGSFADNGEMTDAKLARLNELLNDVDDEDREPDRDSDRQREAPGGGRTRSR